MDAIPHNRPWITAEDRAAVDATLLSGWVAQGPKVAEVEQYFIDRLGGGAACALSSGTAALFLALKGLNIGAGDEVAVPSYACSALLNAVHMAGATARLVDVDALTLCMDPVSVRRLAPRAKAAIAVNTFGARAPVEALQALGLLVIEDCCQSLGGAEAGQWLGRRGDAAVFSFYATKVVAGGQGGLVWSADASVMDRIRDYREFDCREAYVPRFNLQLSDIHAALVLSQLARLEEIVGRRVAIAARYAAALPAGWAMLDDVLVAGRMPYRFIALAPAADRRDALRLHLAERGIRSIVPVERYELLHRYLGLDPADFPVAERLADLALSLPLYPALEEGEIVRVVDAVKDFGQ